MRKIARVIVGGLSLTAIALLAPRAYTALRYQPHIVTVKDAPHEHVAIVFGAGLWRDGRPTAVLYDRVATAVDLYKAGKADKLLLSGDGSPYRNEPAAMAKLARHLGVPDDALALDYTGHSTYDTCYRAKAVYSLTRALFVTQNFHLPRALFICDALGLETVGVSADRRAYLRRSSALWNFREIFATANAWWDVNIAKPVPELGEPLPIQ